jgi:hypothetical protein
MPYAVACLLLGVSFGVLARPVMDPDAVIVMSMVVQLHPGLARVIPLLAPALLAALVVTETGGGSGRSLVIDARVGGLLAAAAAISRRWPLAVVVSCAAGTRRSCARSGSSRAAAGASIAPAAFDIIRGCPASLR